MAGLQSDIDLDSLSAHLEEHVEGFEGLEALEKFATGQSNPTYRVVCKSGLYVLRAKPPGKLLKSAHQVEREYRVMKALADTDVPVPRMLHLATDEASPLGRAFFVMEHLEGRIFWDPSLPDLEPGERGRIYDSMSRTLASLHGVDVERAGLSDFGRPGNYFRRQTERWAGQYRESATVGSPAMDRLSGWLLENVPEDDGQHCLVHGDYRIDNMIFAPGGCSVLGLLDWELSTLGHPLADLAYQCMQWRLPNSGKMRGLGGLDREALGIPGERAYVEAYCRLRGLDGIGSWAFCLAFAFFRLAAILEGVVRRAADGNASNPETARTYAGVIPVLAEMALEVIDRDGGE